MLTFCFLCTFPPELNVKFLKVDLDRHCDIFAYGVEISGFRGEPLDYILPGL